MQNNETINNLRVRYISRFGPAAAVVLTRIEGLQYDAGTAPVPFPYRDALALTGLSRKAVRTAIETLKKEGVLTEEADPKDGRKLFRVGVEKPQGEESEIEESAAQIAPLEHIFSLLEHVVRLSEQAVGPLEHFFDPLEHSEENGKSGHFMYIYIIYIINNLLNKFQKDIYPSFGGISIPKDSPFGPFSSAKASGIVVSSSSVRKSSGRKSDEAAARAAKAYELYRVWAEKLRAQGNRKISVPREFTDVRAKQLKKLAESGEFLENWALVLDHLANYPFFMGMNPDGWVVSLDYLTRRQKFQERLEAAKAWKASGPVKGKYSAPTNRRAGYENADEMRRKWTGEAQGGEA